MSETVCVDRERWERVRAAAQMWDGRVIGSDVPYALPEPGDLDDIPATTERHSVEAMIDELVGLGYDVLVRRSAMRDDVMVASAQAGNKLNMVGSDPDWRAALREAYEQVRRGDGGERG